MVYTPVFVLQSVRKCLKNSQPIESTGCARDFLPQIIEVNCGGLETTKWNQSMSSQQPFRLQNWKIWCTSRLGAKFAVMNDIKGPLSQHLQFDITAETTCLQLLTIVDRWTLGFKVLLTTSPVLTVYSAVFFCRYLRLGLGSLPAC
eukprot:2239493-Amphidinium_carterae.2